MAKPNRVHPALLPAALAALLAACDTIPETVVPATAVEDQLPPAVDLASWDQTTLYSGWRAEDLLDTAVYSPAGEQIGEVENIVIGPDGMIQAIIVEAGGFLDIGDTHLRVPWDRVTLGPGLDRLTVPVTADNVTDYSLFRDFQAAEPRAFRATELLDDYVYLEDRVGYGIVDDLIFSREGELAAVVVSPDPAAAFGYGNYYALPFLGYEFGFDPGIDSFGLPYTPDDLVGVEPFDYDLVEPFGFGLADPGA